MDALTKLKLNIILDFNIFLKSLNKGYVKDYSKILHKISFVQSCLYLGKIDGIYEFLINN